MLPTHHSPEKYQQIEWVHHRQNSKFFFSSKWKLLWQNRSHRFIPQVSRGSKFFPQLRTGKDTRDPTSHTLSSLPLNNGYEWKQLNNFNCLKVSALSVAVPIHLLYKCYLSYLIILFKVSKVSQPKHLNSHINKMTITL